MMRIHTPLARWLGELVTTANMRRSLTVALVFLVVMTSLAAAVPLTRAANTGGRIQYTQKSRDGAAGQRGDGYRNDMGAGARNGLARSDDSNWGFYNDGHGYDKNIGEQLTMHEKKPWLEGRAKVGEERWYKSCPVKCRCYLLQYRRWAGSDIPLKTVNCSTQSMFKFSEDLPINTEVLDMSGNRLRNLTTLPHLPHLKAIDISDNRLTIIDNSWLFEHVGKLKILRLSNNGLSRLEHGTFLGLSRLKELDLSGNRLMNIERHAFTELRRLQVLRLDGNGLYQLERDWFRSLPSLIELHLSQNFLRGLEPGTLTHLPRLQHIDLSHNRLWRLNPDSFAGLDALRFIDISGNVALTEVPVELLKPAAALDILLLDRLGMVRLSERAVSGVSAVELSLSYLPELRVVGRNAFYQLPRVRTLQMHDCPKLAFLHPEAFFGVPNLRRLLIHNNALVAIPSSVVSSAPQLNDLHLYHNPLRCDCNAYWLRKELDEYSKRYYASVNQPTVVRLRSDDNRDDEIIVPSSLLTSTLTHSSSLLSALSISSPTYQQPSSNVSSLSSSPITSSETEASITKSTLNQKILSSQVGSDTFSQGSSSDNSTRTIDRTHSELPKHRSIIHEPGQVSCFFPDGASSLPLVQQPMQYFPEECPPSALPFFPQEVNVSLGEPLDLECHGLGVPEPTVSWLLAGGQITASLKQTETRLAMQDQKSKDKIEGKHEKAQLNLEIKDRAEIHEKSILHIPAVRLSDSGTYGCRVSNAIGQDVSIVNVRVLPRPLRLAHITVSNDYLIVAWEGTIPRIQMQEFQLFYREAPTEHFRYDTREQFEEMIPYKVSTGGKEGFPDALVESKYSGQPSRITNDLIDEKAGGYQVVNVHGSTHTLTVSGLKPVTRYELCLVYQHTHRLQCQYLNTTARDVAAVTRTGNVGHGAGIAEHISRAQIGAGLGVALGLLVTVWAVLVIRRVRRRGRKEYQSYGHTQDDKCSIPLEGLVTASSTTTPGERGGIAAPCTPLTSSRTALLTPSQI